MVLAFTEKQKKEIEATGMMVIEFKCKIGKTIDDAYQVLKEVVDKIVRAWDVFVEKFLELVDSAKLVLEQIREVYHYSTSRRYQIAKVFSKCTGTNLFFGWEITWKIKKWLARSFC